MNPQQRPIYLNLFHFKFPPMAILSILHRISGVLLFLLLPYLFYLLSHSLQSPAQFALVQSTLSQPLHSTLMWITLSAFTFHFFAGIRHLIMDCGVGESLPVARATAYLVMGLQVVAMIALGVWLWG